MNNYIHKIIDFFFHHEVSDEITERVYNRMVFPVEDKAREEAVSQIWDKLDDASCSDEKIEKAFYNLETSLGLKKEEQTVELVHREHIRNTKRINWGSIIRKSKFPQNPKRSVRFSGKRTKRSVQKRKARNTQKAETKIL